MRPQQNIRSAVENVRNESDFHARQLRRIALLSTIGLADFIPISLYQLGVIRHLPDPPGKVFDSDKINRSKEAQIGGIPDGVVSLLMYSTTIVLVGGAMARVIKPGLARTLIGGVLIGQAAGGGYYLFNMATVQRKVCTYCVAGALLNFLALIPLRRLFN